jgi:predicted hydrocarbon binding protein
MPTDPTRGDYFADADAARTDLAAGITRDRAGTRLLGLPDDFLAALHQTAEAACGASAGRVLKAAGREWGRGLAQRLAAELAEFRGEPLTEAPVARFQADLQSAFRHLGWGVLTLDFNRYDKGLLVAEVRHSPPGAAAEALLAGALAGLFSQFAGQELDAVATPAGLDLRRYVIALPERLDRVAEALHRRRPHAEVVAELEEIRV